MKRLLLTLAALGLLSSAAAAQDICPPAKVTTLTQDLTGYHTYTIKWSNTGDDCTTGNADRYELRRSTSAITDTNWQNATIVDSGDAGANGTETCFSVTLNCPATTYYYAVFLFDEDDNRSPLSNVVAGAPRCANPNQEVECY
jgi:hypothetical protein